jgi:methionine biosynthesis protein MetW
LLRITLTKKTQRLPTAFNEVRFQIFFRGRAPVTPALPYEWYDTPNLHILSISDFTQYCTKHRIAIEQSIFLGTRKKIRVLPNLFARTGIFLVAQ